MTTECLITNFTVTTCEPIKIHPAKYRVWEKDGKEMYHGPACSCTSRNQKKIGTLAWNCRHCGRVNHYRQTVDGFLPFTREVAEGIDEYRAEGRNA